MVFRPFVPRLTKNPENGMVISERNGIKADSIVIRTEQKLQGDCNHDRICII